MTPKPSLITVVEGIEEGLERLQEYEKTPLNRDYDPKSINSLMPTSFSSSESEDSESDSEMQKFDYLEDEDDEEAEIDTTQPAQQKSTKKIDESTFRGRPSSCVFVASLAASLSDDELSMSVTNHFSQWGELALVKVLRDPANRPYAFVQYTNDKDAKLALKKAQHTTLNGRTIRCEPAKVNRTLYIATCNGYDITLKHIRETLEKYGEIEQMIGNNDTSYRKSNLNKAWFAKFAYRDDAIRAYANLRLSPEWIVEWAQNIERPADKDDQEDEVEIDKCSIFVGQLDSKATKELLSERFSKHGPVSEVVLVMRPGNNFAFIKFENDKAAAAAVERENHAVFMEKTMHVQYRELHHKKKKFTSPVPRLNLAPPPVNLPVRRASTGSRVSSDSSYRAPMGHFGAGFSRVPSISGKPLPAKVQPGRSVSFSHEKAGRLYPYDGEQFASLGRIHGTPPKDESAYSAGKNTPLSSPSNHTLNSSSNGEAKSVFSATTVSASEHHHDEVMNPSMTAFHHGKPPARGSLSHLPHSQGMGHPPPPPSSYYYYMPPKDSMIYDQSSFPGVPTYPPYTYYYPESSVPVEFTQPSAMGASGVMPAAPYYMYYSIPQTPTYGESKTSKGRGFDGAEAPAGSIKDEMDY